LEKKRTPAKKKTRIPIIMPTWGERIIIEEYWGRKEKCGRLTSTFEGVS